MDISSYRSLVQRYIHNFLWLRWIIFAGGFLIVLCLELYQDSLNSSAIGVSIEEIVIYGLIGPAIIWLLLTVLAQNMPAQAARADMLIQQQHLTRDLALHKDYDQLLQFIVRYPATVLPIQHTSIFIYDHMRARLEFADEWNSSAMQTSPVSRYLHTQRLCQACLLIRRPASQHTGACVFATDSCDNEYCFPLTYDKMLIGVLRFQSESGKRLEQSQLDYMKEISPQVALALVLAIAHTRELEYIRAEVQSDERRRLTSVLHNSLAQQVFYLQLELDQLANDEEGSISQTGQARLQRLHGAIHNLSDEIRSSLTILRAWEHLKLLQAVKILTQAVELRSNLEIEIVMQGDEYHLDTDTRRQIYSFIQEGLNNIEKHAQAKHIQIELIWEDDCLSICLTDDGRGFEPSAMPAHGHFGLSILREQTFALRGQFTLESSSGNGTCLRFKIPLRTSGRARQPSDIFALDEYQPATMPN